MLRWACLLLWLTQPQYTASTDARLRNLPGPPLCGLWCVWLYRTGKFTEHELAAKYSVSRSAVNKQISKNGWTKDLQGEIRQATNARLVQLLVAEEVAKSGMEVANVVIATANENTRVILSHRARLARLNDAVEYPCKVPIQRVYTRCANLAVLAVRVLVVQPC